MKVSKMPHAGTLRLLFNITLVLLTALASFGVVAATDNPQPPPGERTAADPYDQWTEEFLDFVPPNPDVMELAQPDGTSFKAQLTPMETGGQMETPDGYTVVKNDQGWWTYAQPGDGVTTPADQAVPSSLIPGKDEPQGLAKKAGQHKSIWLDDQGNDKRDAVFEAVKNVQSPNNSMFTANAVEPKRYRYVVIMVEFQDVKFEPYQTREWFQKQISGLRGSPTGTVTDLYNEMSYGRFIPELDVYGPVTSDYNMAKFDYQLSGGWSVSAMINNEIGAKVKNLVNWDQYDNDRVVYTSGGVQYRSVDMVVILHAGPDKAATGQPGHIWSHASTANFRTGLYGSDGRELRIRGANTNPAIGFNIGVVSHEMGHTIGESDYYATSYNSMGTGDYELMSGGSWMGDDPAGSNPTHMNPFSKVNQGWVETAKITGTTLGIELAPRSIAPNIIEIPLGGSGSGSTGADERLFVEYMSNRAPEAIFDKAAYNSGLLIWHYDRGGSQNNPARLRMSVEEYDYRDGTQELRLNLNRGEPSDVWRDTALGMTPYTSPNTNRDTPLTAGGSTATGWYIMNISPLAPVMTLDIVREADVTAKLGLDRPGLAQQPVIAGSGPADLTTKVYNLTAAPLENVRVQFLATVGEQQVQLAETTLATLPPGPPVAVTATWATPMVGKFTLEAKASVGNEPAVSTLGMARVFGRIAPVLVVDDDDSYAAEEAFEGALTSLGVPYVLVERTASLATLSQYELVIWSAGQAGRMQGQLNNQERADLKAFLNAGGKLWMSSPRLASALAATGAAPGVDPNMLRDYFGAAYPMSSQAGGGTITGLGQPIGGNASFELRPFPGRAIEDYLDPATSQIGTGVMLFSWSFGHHLGTEVIGDAAHNNFHVVFFGFNLSQVISGADRLTLTQQVLESMGMASVYFDKITYLMQTSGAVKVTVHDLDATAPKVTVTSDAQPTGVVVSLVPTEIPGTFTGVLNIQKTNSAGDALKVNNTDTLRVVYEDSPGHTLWSTAAVLLKADKDQPATIYHDPIYNARDAENLPVMAVVSDDIRVQKVDLYYRVAGSGAYILLPMEETARSAYTAMVPASAVTPMGVEYYIRARDSKGTLTLVGSAASPIFAVVQPRTLTTP